MLTGESNMEEETSDLSLLQEDTLVKITNLNATQMKLLEEFDCGVQSINDYLKKDALEDSQLGITKTWLFFEGGNLIGYFSLTTDRMTVIKRSTVHKKLSVKLNYKSIPSIQIHHFAVNKIYQKKPEKNGQHLMDIALYFIKYNLLSMTGACLITVFSLKSSVGFYKKIGFEKTGDSRDQTNVAMAFFTADLF